jgi:hypothetical protein
LLLASSSFATDIMSIASHTPSTCEGTCFNCAHTKFPNARHTAL